MDVVQLGDLRENRALKKEIEELQKGQQIITLFENNPELVDQLSEMIAGKLESI